MSIVWLLEHQADEAPSDNELVPCGIFDTLEQARNAAEAHTHGAWYDDWHESRWLDGTGVYLRYYDATKADFRCHWRIVPLEYGAFNLEYQIIGKL